MKRDGERRGGECYHEDRGAAKGRHWNVEVFLSCVFKDTCFPLQCDHGIKIMTSPPI